MTKDQSDAVLSKSPMEEDICEVHIAKQRRGEMGKVINLVFNNETTSLHTTDIILGEQERYNLNVCTQDDFRGDDDYLYSVDLPPKEDLIESTSPVINEVKTDILLPNDSSSNISYNKGLL